MTVQNNNNGRPEVCFSYEWSNGCSFVAKADSFDIVRGREVYFSFPVSCALVLEKAEDRDTAVSFKESQSLSGGAKVVWSAKSPVMGDKEYTARITGEGVALSVKQLSAPASADTVKEIKFFAGAEGKRAANYFMSRYMLPANDCSDRENSTYAVGTDRDLIPGMLCPAPFVFPFENEFDDTRIGIGFAAPAGANSFTRMGVCFKKPVEMWFRIPYPTAAGVTAAYVFPTAFICFGSDAYDVISRWADWARREFRYPVKKRTAVPDWWRSPIFCGWMEQDQRARATGLDTKELSTQEEYERMRSRMARAGLRPGIIIIDDKWQVDYGTMTVDRKKWPDLRAFTDDCHARGQRVLLWWRLWNPDGLPGDACAKDRGVTVCADPCSDGYRERIRQALRVLLGSGEGEMNCDGFKLDYIYRVPDDRLGIRFSGGNPQGIELMREYYKFIYDAVKDIKPDALVNTSFAHPYFDDCFDQIRLHDYDSIQRETVTQMTRRANTVRAVYPGCLIDTDGGNALTGRPEPLLRHNRAAVKIGSPALYTLTPLSDEDLREIQRTWDEYTRLQSGRSEE